MRHWRIASLRRLPAADTVATVSLLVIFGGAYIQAVHWPLRTGLFPRLVVGAAFLLAVFQLVSLLREAMRSAEVTEAIIEGAKAPAKEADEDVSQEMEYVFAHAGRRAWIEALGWVAAFFVGLYVLGLYITAPLFAASYLWFVAKASWRVSLIYAAVTAVVLYGAFDWLLDQPVPTGLF